LKNFFRLNGIVYSAIVSSEIKDMSKTSKTDNSENPSNRCRLVLVVPPLENAEALLAAAIKGGDIASIILPNKDMSESAYQDHVEALTKLAQGNDIAVIVQDDSQAMGRSGADGIFVASGIEALKETLARFSPKRIVGYGGVRTRHNAMEAAELYPDFLFLGKLDGDIKPEAHPKNVALAQWASELMQVSIIVMGGSTLESTIDVAKSGAEFVALSHAVFSHVDGPEAAVSLANQLLEDHSVRFDDEA